MSHFYFWYPLFAILFMGRGLLYMQATIEDLVAKGHYRPTYSELGVLVNCFLQGVLWPLSLLLIIFAIARKGR